MRSPLSLSRRLDKIAQQLGAGVPLIREALIELEHQGFVQRTPYKGTTVTKLSPADVRRIFALRVELEAVAIEERAADQAKRGPRMALSAAD